MQRLAFRSVFVSDVHLGLRECQAGYLLDFLRSIRCEQLYLVGDILDIENMARRPYWHADHGAVIAQVLALAAGGTRVTYIPGNHDAPLRRMAGHRVCGIEIALESEHRGADGRRYRVSHGDEFDGGVAIPAWLQRLGDVLQGVLCSANRRVNHVLRALGMHYRPFSIRLKSRVARARRFILDFENRVADRARRDGFDGHICGHIHYGSLREQDGVLYLNDGDWVEHCTALVEHADGTFELLHWTERRVSLAREAPLPARVAELPAAA